MGFLTIKCIKSGDLCWHSARETEEIQNIAGIPIDHSSLKYRKELTEYGYRVGKIFMKKQTVIFERKMVTVPLREQSLTRKTP